MKKLAITCTLLFIAGMLTAQYNTAYEALIAKAGLFHLQKNYKEAISTFEQAFALTTPDALNAYKVAGAYALDSNADKAFHYLELALKLGYTEADWLAADPYFDYLRSTDPGRWKKLKENAFASETQFSQTLKKPLLRKQINTIVLSDQQLRYKRAQAATKKERQEIDKAIQHSDLQNIEMAKYILRRNGWPKLSDIGRDGQNNLWLLIQHADMNVTFQRQALDSMKVLLGTPELNPENYAFLYDRVQCNLNYRQLYGTQVNWTHNGQASGFRPIQQEHEADTRRKELGMLPLQLYALTYGFAYEPISKTQADENERHDHQLVSALMDSAQKYYEKKEYQKVYDTYNEASTIMGGMSNEDNFLAAKVLAKIADKTKEQQYKDISLDFLNLLWLRGELTKKRLKKEAAFDILHSEARWVEMYEQS
ncbi:MAG: hypothetical protein QM731_28365 [Chitinophagaceae bacterium]